MSVESPKIVVVAGARPNFMKVAPVIQALKARRANVIFVHTGQHYDARMSDNFLEELGIPVPDINLCVGSGSHAEQTANVMIRFERVCTEHKPDWVVVVGDVNSTVAATLTARKLGIRVAHVEAGLRSGDMGMPEEINRLCTDAIADVLFTTDAGADANLLREGVARERIELVGNTMIDTLLRNLPRAARLSLPAGLTPRGYGVLTLHRPSNVDAREALSPLFETVLQIAERIPLAFPMHPRTRASLERFGLLPEDPTAKGVHIMEPLGYLAFIRLVSASRLVLTDSGGIQEESTVMNIPCLTLRHNTERPVTCSLGTNQLVGTARERILDSVDKVLSRPGPCVAPPPLWDGMAGERIANVLLRGGETRV